MSDYLKSQTYELAEALQPVGNARVAALIAVRDKIIRYGVNKNKSHPFAAKYGKNEQSIYLHAETDAILNALKYFDHPDELQKATIYIARAKKVSTHDHSMMMGMAKPCLGCQRALATFGICDVVYTTDEQTWENL
jgi:deoxycytidylate deaminase